MIVVMPSSTPPTPGLCRGRPALDLLQSIPKRRRLVADEVGIGVAPAEVVLGVNLVAAGLEPEQELTEPTADPLTSMPETPARLVTLCDAELDGDLASRPAFA